MNTLDNYIAEYLEYCEYRKRLDPKSIKAYRIDLKQYLNFCYHSNDFLSRDTVDFFITALHKQYKPKTVKRKIASLKSFFIILSTKIYYQKTRLPDWMSIFAKPNFFPKQSPFIPSKNFCPYYIRKKVRLLLLTSVVAPSGILLLLSYCLLPECESPNYVDCGHPMLTLKIILY